MINMRSPLCLLSLPLLNNGIFSSFIPIMLTEEHEESVYNRYISELRNFRMLLEAHEEHLIRQLRTPLERDDLEQSLQRISEQEVGIYAGVILRYIRCL